MFDPDEVIVMNGHMVTKDVLFHKVKSLGWTQRLFGELTDEQMVEAVTSRKTPASMGKSLAATFTPNDGKPGVPSLDSDEGSDPSVMAPLGVKPQEEPPAIAPAGPALTSGVVPTVATPLPKHLRPVDPTRPATAATAVPMLPAQPGQPMPQAPRAINVKPPKTDTAKLLSMLDASRELAGQDATMSTAKTLVTTNDLQRAFQSMYPELAKKVLGHFDSTPDPKCRGGVVLDIEVEADSGYVHIVTSAGVITITGNNITHQGAKP